MGVILTIACEGPPGEASQVAPDGTRSLRVLSVT
jgi:hypothetical protein